MAELAASAFAALSSAFVTAAPAAASAGATAATAGATAAASTVGAAAAAGAAATTGATAATGLAGAGSGLLSSLQGVASVGSMVSSLFAGGAGLATGIQNARLSDINAHAAQLESEMRAIEIRRNLVQTIGNNRVAFAASGLDISSGAAIEQGLQSQAGFQETMARGSGDMAALSQQMRGANEEIGGWAKLAAGVGQARTTAAKYGLDLSKRG